jgi:hypothetical protein
VTTLKAFFELPKEHIDHKMATAIPDHDCAPVCNLRWFHKLFEFPNEKVLVWAVIDSNQEARMFPMGNSRFKETWADMKMGKFIGFELQDVYARYPSQKFDEPIEHIDPETGEKTYQDKLIIPVVCGEGV